MKIRRSPVSCLIPSAGVRTALFVVSALFTVAGIARAQTILVADPNGTNGVSSYNINGTLINASLVAGTSFEGLALSGSTLYIANDTGPSSIGTATLNGTGGVSSTGTFFTGGVANGMNSPYGLAVTATNLYVANFNTGNVFQIDLSSHLEVNTLSTINGNGGANPNPYGLAISGNTIWVSQATTGTGINTIKGYDLTNFNASPITITSDLNLPHGLAVSGNTLFVANGGDGTIWTFDATTGASIGITPLVSGLTGPQGITVYGSSLFVTGSDGTVKGFDASTGLALGGFTTITGLSSPYGIVVSSASAIPEPSTYAAIFGVATLGFAGWRRRRLNAVARTP